MFSDCHYKFKIKDLVIEYNQRIKENNQYELLSSTASGIYFQKDYFNKQVVTLDNTGYKILPRGYITYRSMSDTGKFHFNIQNIIDYGIISPAYPVFITDSKKVNKKYFIYYINENSFFKNRILAAKEGGTRYALSFTKFKDMVVYLPSLEQQDYFSKLLYFFSSKIINEKKKINKLKEFKKGLMQNMFV